MLKAELIQLRHDLVKYNDHLSAIGKKEQDQPLRAIISDLEMLVNRMPGPIVQEEEKGFANGKYLHRSQTVPPFVDSFESTMQLMQALGDKITSVMPCNLNFAIFVVTEDKNVKYLSSMLGPGWVDIIKNFLDKIRAHLEA